jgi:preprotein translocase subunit SecF
VADEGPFATAGAFLMVLLVIIVAFRRPRHIAILGCAMISGVVLMMGVAVLLGQKINPPLLRLRKRFPIVEVVDVRG